MINPEMPNQLRLLVIEDDPGLGRGLSVNLEAEGYEVRWNRDLRSAGNSLPDFAPDLILLDLNLPDGNGLQFLRRIRAEKATSPVIILTARTHEDSVVEGLNAGANDYVKKPFSQKELMARIRAALRESQKHDPDLAYHGLQVLLNQRKVIYQDQELELNRREFDILSYFIAHSESVVTREALLNLFDRDGEIFDRTIDSHVSHVRARLKKAKIEDLKISSVYGVGYRLESIR